MQGNRLYLDRRSLIDRLIQRRDGRRIRLEQREPQQRRALKAPEGVRLVRPIEIPQRARIPVEMMLGLNVVPNDSIEPISRAPVGGHWLVGAHTLAASLLSRAKKSKRIALG